MVIVVRVIYPRFSKSAFRGGLSGLSAAKDIAAAGKSFAILEARDRVGGRVLNVNLLDGQAEEAGAEFVGPTQDRVLALADSLGLTTYPTYREGNCSMLRNGTLTTYPFQPSSIPPLSTEVLLELLSFQSDLNSMAAGVSTEAPWDHPNASIWDNMTVATYLDSKITLSDSRFLLENDITSVLSTEPNEPSLLYLLAYIAGGANKKTTGTIGRLINVADGAQESRIDGGTQLLPLKLADGLGSKNIHLSNPVRKITLENDQYTVTSDKMQISTQQVIVAMSPPMAGRISYYPLLPAGRDQLTQRMAMGAIGKAIAIYPYPWWRKLGLNVQGLSDSGSIRVTYDNSPKEASFGAIMGFIEADEMRKLDDSGEKKVRAQVIQSLVGMFGDQAANPTRVINQRWDAEEFSRGGPVAFAPPGVLTEYGPHLKAPVGGIHFAGTETSLEWAGHMDGAISSGERVAAEVLMALK
ncbi:hypothetical protein N7478_000196 [Penicillium angulare]|uniref:uncharacterized protein n=1 Tax=Penicillium angulare TaxID=116970 RepID=UPI00253FDE13|nr:uncharacterized protein N7478_000196 [Penicillium angulare]KAJ5290945.1 hypothetical protein N7478_000196 [Penicillium angulare]